jgi:hypothetical protein
MMFLKNKRGFIRILEAFISILLITGVLLVVINNGYLKRGGPDSQIYDAEVSILREIELDDNLRSTILEIPFASLPANWGDPLFPDEVEQRVIERTPEYLNCSSNICKLDSVCGMETYIEEDVYVQSVAIAANLDIYQPKKIKLFCWVK